MRRAARPSHLMAPISTFPRREKAYKESQSNLQSQAAEATVARAYRPASRALLLCPQASTQGGGGLPGACVGTECQEMCDVSLALIALQGVQAARCTGQDRQSPWARIARLSGGLGAVPCPGDKSSGPSVRLKPSVREGPVSTLTPQTGDRGGSRAQGPRRAPRPSAACTHVQLPPGCLLLLPLLGHPLRPLSARPSASVLLFLLLRQVFKVRLMLLVLLFTRGRRDSPRAPLPPHTRPA